MAIDVLSRTRRNMIGVSFVIILIGLFGWDYPRHLTIFGWTIRAVPGAVAGILWLGLIYLCWEYWINIRDRITGLRTVWLDGFVRRIKPKAVQFYS